MDNERLKYDHYDRRVYTRDQYIDACLGGLPNPDMLAEQWEKLPDVQIGYNSEPDTLRHIRRVNELLLTVYANLLRRAARHDESKLGPEEKPHFDRLTPLLAGSTYMSEEYAAFLRELKPALDNHYQENDHHPEHYDGGVNGMSLMALLEMFVDWKAATERHADGNILVSIEKNRSRFRLSGQLVDILINTAREMGWLNQNQDG